MTSRAKLKSTPKRSARPKGAAKPRRAAKPKRSLRVEARITPENLDVIKRAAEIQGRSVSDFVNTAAQEIANRVIEETQIIRLSVADQRLIAEAILNPPEPSPGLRRAFESRRRLLESDV
jgi:uncharacterized protein (DUF1778 family)